MNTVAENLHPNLTCPATLVNNTRRKELKGGSLYPWEWAGSQGRSCKVSSHGFTLPPSAGQKCTFCGSEGSTWNTLPRHQWPPHTGSGRLQRLSQSLLLTLAFEATPTQLQWRLQGSQSMYFYLTSSTIYLCHMEIRPAHPTTTPGDPICAAEK